MRLSKLSLILMGLILLTIVTGLSYLPTASSANTHDRTLENLTPGPREGYSQEEEPVSPRPTAVFAVEPQISSMPINPWNQAQNPANEPLRFAFPTPAAPPVSALRPALYPTPWALTPYDHFYFSRPIAANEINWPLADYRYGGVFFEDVVHSGVDIPAPMKTPVLAAGAGKVTWAGYGLYYGIVDTSDPYGLAVMIRHDFGYQGEKLYTVYAHLDRVDVAKGEFVQSGDQIGLSGQTGMVTGPHLHFELRLAKDEFFSTRNPELWLVPAQGWGVVAGRVMSRTNVPLESHLVTVTSIGSGQNWKAYTYSRGMVKSDLYYRENMVISDLPAGRYEVKINYWGKNLAQEIQVNPGLVSYFTFRGWDGFSLDLPPAPGADFVPSSP